jgi:hypothetical protein
VIAAHFADNVVAERYDASRASPPSGEIVAAAGFREVLSERFVHAETYTLDELIAYLMTQTNVTAAARGGGDSADAIRAWLGATLAPFFASRERGTFDYDGTLSVLETTG